MSQITVGMKVRHKTSGEKAVVTEIIDGKSAVVSYGFHKVDTVSLVELEPLNEEATPLRLSRA